MGLQAMIKGAWAPVKTNNTTNPRAMKELDRRVTDIAADLERSKDPVKKDKLQRIVHTVAEGFKNPADADGISDRLAPVQFIQRQALILNADKELNDIKPPAPGRTTTMEKATMKDYKSLEHEIKKLTEPAIMSLRQLNELLPDSKTMQSADACDQLERIVAEQAGINDLQKAMAQFTHKVTQMKEKGIINPDVLVTIFKVDDPDSEPIHHTIAGEKSFAELADDFLAEDDVLPDFWIRKVNPEENSVTPTNHWWEFQDPKIKVGEAFPKVDGQETRRIELIAREGDYIVALIHDNGMEKCHPVDLPRKKAPPARDYLPGIFKGQKIGKILKLKDGSDVSNLVFDRRSFEPRTNKWYVEIEGVLPESATACGGTI